ncbi:MAG: hypothetical protein ICV80_05330 [Microcoleus sp. T1-bin1]|nr:hypothetical protein [Microcoleus sp. T1-bin1]MBD0339406.1 hypothetical protein [Microcoleus sp. Co-bin12]
MTEPKPTPEKQNSSATPNSSEIRPNSADENTAPQKATGFFNTVRIGLAKPEPEPMLPSEAKEILVDD